MKVYIELDGFPGAFFRLHEAQVTMHDLRHAVYALQDEAARRYEAKRIADVWQPAMAAASNLMLGVTHALACRAHLRSSAGHKPFWSPNNLFADRAGSTPAHGRMWTASEGALAAEKTRWYTPTEPIASSYAGISTRSLSVSPLTLDALRTRNYLRDKGYSWLIPRL